MKKINLELNGETVRYLQAIKNLSNRSMDDIINVILSIELIKRNGIKKYEKKKSQKSKK